MRGKGVVYGVLALVIVFGLLAFFGAYNFFTGNVISLGERVGESSISEAITFLFGDKESEATTPLETSPVYGAQGEDLPASNTIKITEKDGVPRTNYPVQIGRVFRKGDISSYPQAKIGITLIATQSDVKSRWDDGSVKHAIMTFYINLTANEEKTIEFVNQASGNNNGFLTQQQMLNNYNFDAVIELAYNGQTRTASARQMLQNGDFTYWLNGTQSTSIILADHSLTREYDIGFDNHKSFRPIFLATFFNNGKVRVRYIGEVSNTEVLQDMQYNVNLKIGNTNSQTVFSQNGVYHYAAARWTKEFWIGGASGNVDINHNLAYLKETKFMPNYDTSITIPLSTLDSYYDYWRTAKPSSNLFDTGGYVEYMGAPGGREELGPMPQWTIMWLYSGDYRYAEMNAIMADLAAAWPMHLREGSANRFFNKEKNVLALGKVLSTNARRTFRFINFQGISGDFVNIVGSITRNPWQPDCAHVPEPYSIQYALTGDYWYLEQSWFWASRGSFASGYGNETYSRGPTGVEGDLNSVETRGEGRCLNVRGNAAFISPDDSIEKQHFSRLIEDYISSKEGLFNIQGTIYQGNTMWNWGKDIISKRWRHHYNLPGPPPVLHHLGVGLEEPSPYFSGDVLYDPPWKHSILVYTLGHLEELGFETGALKDYLGEYLVGYITNPNVQIKYLIGQAKVPIFNEITSSYVNTYEEILPYYIPSHLEELRSEFEGRFAGSVSANHGYSVMAMGAISYLTDIPGGQESWDWMLSQANLVPTWSSSREQNPQWAILPRDEPTELILSSISPSAVSASSQTLFTFSGYNFDSNAELEICDSSPSPVCGNISNPPVSFVNSQTLTYEVTLGTTAHTFGFRVYNPTTNEYSNQKFVNVIAPLITPSNLETSSITSSRVDLTWADNSNNEQGFYIERSLSPNSGFVRIGTNNANDNTYTDNSVSANTVYYYRVRAYYSAIYSSYSNVVNATTSQSVSLIIGHWKFDDTVSPTDNALDSSGNNLHGTCTTGACPTYLSSGGNRAGAYRFDGMNDEIVVADNYSLDLTTQGTMMAWVKLYSLSKWHGILTKGNAPTHAYGIEIDNTRLVCQLNGRDNFVTGFIFNVGTYYHVACTWSAGTLRAYINGVQIGNSFSFTSNPSANTGGLHIGSWPPASGDDWDWMNGSIDDVKIYNYALTSSEINESMQGSVVVNHCGDGACNNGETCSTCPGDCGACPGNGGNGNGNGGGGGGGGGDSGINVEANFDLRDSLTTNLTKDDTLRVIFGGRTTQLKISSIRGNTLTLSFMGLNRNVLVDLGQEVGVNLDNSSEDDVKIKLNNIFSASKVGLKVSKIPREPSYIGNTTPPGAGGNGPNSPTTGKVENSFKVLAGFILTSIVALAAAYYLIYRFRKKKRTVAFEQIHSFKSELEMMKKRSTSL